MSIKTTTVETSVGQWILKKPKAGVRNRALINSQFNGKTNTPKFLVEILLGMIHKRPDGVDQTVPISDLLDSLEIEDYDALIMGTNDLINQQGDDKKKPNASSETLSDTELSQKTHTGETNSSNSST